MLLQANSRKFWVAPHNLEWQIWKILFAVECVL